MAASAASVAIMGADKVLISPTAQIMIHKALYGYVSGNSDDLDKASNALKSSDKAIINAYVAKTGLSEEEILEMMRNETYMSASEAVEKGFADEVMSFDDVGAVAMDCYRKRLLMTSTLTVASVSQKFKICYEK